MTSQLRYSIRQKSRGLAQYTQEKFLTCSNLITFPNKSLVFSIICVRNSASGTGCFTSEYVAASGIFSVRNENTRTGERKNVRKYSNLFSSLEWVRWSGQRISFISRNKVERIINHNKHKNEIVSLAQQEVRAARASMRKVPTSLKETPHTRLH